MADLYCSLVCCHRALTYTHLCLTPSSTESCGDGTGCTNALLGLAGDDHHMVNPCFIGMKDTWRAPCGMKTYTSGAANSTPSGGSCNRSKESCKVLQPDSGGRLSAGMTGQRLATLVQEAAMLVSVPSTYACVAARHGCPLRR